RTAGDPWCIGYFVDNELTWRGEVSLAAAALESPPEQPAKKAFVEDLKAKYGSVDGLNAAWGTEHASWDALLESRQAPPRQKAKQDLGAFYTKLAETYFRVCREEVKRVAPDNMYLGCRFSPWNDRALRAAAKYCDVVSFNLYRRGVETLGLPEGVDKPVIVGEFHFGALDRGMFHTGLQGVASQEERAASYKSYVAGALRNPLVVGTHWFQYGSQATTGRGDGENFQIGFVDICDTPYPETIQACREAGYSLYDLRATGESDS
ncbi:MAG: beta-galactosidase, partial [Planctomycetota bacterium]